MGEVKPPSKENILHNLRGLQESEHFNNLYCWDGWAGRQYPDMVRLVDLDSLSGMYIGYANGACNRTAPVLLIQDSWHHYLTTDIFVQELLMYKYKRWFRPYESNIDKGQFLTKVCTLPKSPAPPTEACSQETADYIKIWNANLCARIALAQSNELDYEEENVGEHLYHIRPLFRAVVVAIRYSSFNVMVTDISTISVLVIRTGVEDGLSAPIDLEQVPESDRRAVVTDSQGRLSAVEVTLETAITFLMALEKREEADGPVTRDVIQSTRILDPMCDTAASRREEFGWDDEKMGLLRGPSSSWVDAAKRPTWSGEGNESFKYYQEMLERKREEAKPIMREMQDIESWGEYMREQKERREQSEQEQEK